MRTFIQVHIRRLVRGSSLTENLEDTASDKLVEGIHALAEFYSTNLATEIRRASHATRQ